MIRRVTIEIICFLSIALFVYAAAAKLLDYERFNVQLGQSPLLTSIAPHVAWIVPSVELGVALMLTVPRWRLGGLYGAFSLMVMFTAYIIAILTSGEFIPCSCGGILERMGWNEHLVFNLIFLLLSMTGIVLLDHGKHIPTDITDHPRHA